MFRSLLPRAVPRVVALAVLVPLLASLAGTFGLPVVAVADTTHALVGASVVVRPGEVIDDATVVVRGDRILAVGPRSAVEVPPDARVWEGEGLRVYAGFLEPWYEIELPEPAESSAQDDPGLPGPSTTSTLLHPERRAVDGLGLSEEQLSALREGGFTVAAVVPADGVLRGRAAVVHTGSGRPEERVLRAEAGVVAELRGGGWGARAYPSSVMGAVAALRQALFDARHYLDDHAHYRRHAEDRDRPPYDPALEALAPVVRGEQPLLLEPGGVVMAHRALALATEHDIRAVLLGTGGEWRRPDLIPPDASLILPLDFPDAPEVPEQDDWIDVGLDELRHWDWAPEVPALMAGRGMRFAFTSHGLGEPAQLWSKLRAAGERGLMEVVAVDALTTRPASFLGMEDRLGTVAAGKLAYLTVLRGEGLFDEDAEVAMLFVDGEPLVQNRDDGDEREGSSDETARAEVADPGAAEGGTAAKGTAGGKEIPRRVARDPREDRGPFLRPDVVVVRDATLWTSAEAGVLEQADLLVRDGRIVAIGPDLDAPDDAHVVDASGLHVTAGLIDAHSHIAVIGGVNEGTNSTTAEVRIRDVLNSEDPRIHEQLAGGLTSSHIMHGSANAIGGQCQAIKLRWGAGPDGLVLEGARPTIKFALGENPKRSNWNPGPGVPRRYPRTRMGVEDVIRERFAAAQEYARVREEWDSDDGPYPRRDLQLEALAEILADERDIHCHSYRQDEILALMRLMEEFDGRVAVFQHVLEGYKVADELADHGAMASTFADWWAYKFEVYDAIPHGTTLMDERGVVTSVNSDSPDLARRMNTEAAKSVRYGGSDEERALAMVTINAAVQLGADDRIGSLEVRP